MKKRQFTLLMTALYAISYMTRINYAAVISAIIAGEGLSAAAAALPLTACAITYGAGQFISGSLGDRFQPRTIVAIGLFLTATCNMAFSFVSSPYVMTGIWTVNGFAQSMMWPPLAKLIATVMPQADEYQKATGTVMRGASYGTIAVYLASPLLIHYLGWRAVFAVSAILAITMAVIWLCRCPTIGMEKTVSDVPKKMSRFPWSLLLIAAMFAIFLQGMLRDGVTTWTPTYIGATFSLGSELSILSGVVMPIFSALSIAVTGWLSRRLIRNELLLATLLFGVAAVASFTLPMLGRVGAVPSIIMLALLIGSMHGVNLLLTCYLPPFFATDRLSTVVGVMNSCTYIGTAVSTYGIAAFSDRFGWSATTVLWAAIAAGGVLVCRAFSTRFAQLKNHRK